MQAYFKRSVQLLTKPVDVSLSEAERLAVGIIFGNDDIAAGNWLRYKEKFDIDTLYLGRGTSLLPSLAKRMAKICPNDPWLGKLTGYDKYVWTRNQLSLRRVSEVISALNQQSIEHLLLNDAAILLMAYPQTGGRLISDQSILVRPCDSARASQFQLSQVSVAEDGIGVWTTTSFGCELEGLAWQDSRQEFLLGVQASVPSRAVLIIHTLLSIRYVKLNQAQWFTDVANLIVSGESGDAAKLASLLERRSISVPVLQSWWAFEQVCRLSDIKFDRYPLAQALIDLSISPGEFGLRALGKVFSIGGLRQPK